jgi:glycosyltransferase involved in cell wall biosynthesis
VYGNPEVANELTGFSVPFDASPESLAALIDSFAADAERQEKIRSSARNFYLGHFNAAVNYPAFASGLIQQR